MMSQVQCFYNLLCNINQNRTETDGMQLADQCVSVMFLQFTDQTVSHSHVSSLQGSYRQEKSHRTIVYGTSSTSTSSTSWAHEYTTVQLGTGMK